MNKFKYKDYLETMIVGKNTTEQDLTEEQKNTVSGAKFMLNNVQSEILYLENTIENTTDESQRYLARIKRIALITCFEHLLDDVKDLVDEFGKENKYAKKAKKENLHKSYENTAAVIQNKLNEQEKTKEIEIIGSLEENILSDMINQNDVVEEAQQLSEKPLKDKTPQIVVPEEKKQDSKDYLKKVNIDDYLKTNLTDTVENLLEKWNKNYKTLSNEREQLYLEDGYSEFARKTDEDVAKLYKNHPEFLEKMKDFEKSRASKLQKLIEEHGIDDIKRMCVLIVAGKELENKKTTQGNVDKLLPLYEATYMKLKDEHIEKLLLNNHPNKLVKWLREGIRILKNSQR